jgi:4-alpha-glucanotransferase
VTGRPGPAADPRAWGILPGHHHVRGEWIPASEVGTAAALAAMGADGPEPPPTPIWVVTAEERVGIPGRGVVHTEEGGRIEVRDRCPALPLGYHRIELADQEVRLIVSPGRCLRPPRRVWGWAVQLYAARSEQSWGIGDLADLRRLGRHAAAQGAGMVLINPLHAAAPTPSQQPSPYFPSSRRWRNPLYLRIEDVAADLATAQGSALAELDDLAAVGRALNDGRRIDRDRIWELKRKALFLLFTTGSGAGRGADYLRWASAQGAALERFATFNAIAETHGGDWRQWPVGLRDPGQPEVALFARANQTTVAFHQWLQFLLDRQLAAAATRLPVVGDLAIGVDPGGADAWEWQDVLAAGVSVGAPPDEFSPSGQDWGLPPFDPWRLRAAAYQPFVDTVRFGLARLGGLRVDHVAGLFRLFWVPPGGDASQGVYVRYPWRDLLNIVALESHRAGAFVVGEDLGTVEDEARHALAQASVLSYRLLWFEDRPPSEWPKLALAAVTTHDLPTISGVWTGADLAARREIGVAVDEAAELGLRDRLAQTVGVAIAVEQTAGINGVDGGSRGPSPVPVGEMTQRAYGALADSPCLIVAATLEDALEVDERPNQPGTLDQWPNWSLALPLPLEEIEGDTRVLAVARTLSQHRSSRSDHAVDMAPET